MKAHHTFSAVVFLLTFSTAATQALSALEAEENAKILNESFVLDLQQRGNPKYSLQDGNVYSRNEFTLSPFQSESPDDSYESCGGGAPMLTDDTSTLEKGHWEINLAFTAETSNQQTEIAAPLLDINYGITDHVQINYQVPWITHLNNDEDNQTGIGNSRIGLKYRFLNHEKTRLAMSIYPQVGWNNDQASVRKGLVDKGVEILLPVEIQKTLGRFTVGAELGYGFLASEPAEGEFVYGTVAGYHASPKIQLLAEIHGSSSTDLEEHEVLVNLGSRIELNDIASVLISAGHTVYESGSDAGFVCYIGLQLRH